MKTLISRIITIVLMQFFAGSLLAHVELDNPLGGETFIVGQTVTIQWHIAIPHNTLNWDVLFSSDGGATWSFIQMDLPVGSLSYSWVVPDIITSQARVSVIQDNSGTDYQDESMNFTIQAPPMLPFIVLGAIDTTIESNIAYQDDAIQSWLDNHGGATATNFCNDLIWSNDYTGLNYTCGASGNAVVTFTATDDCGSAETVATVTVSDTSPPVLELAASPLLVECDGIGNTTELNVWLGNQGGAIASDAGGSVNWFTDENWSEIVCGSTSILYMIFVAADECSNFTSTQSTFTIEDHTPPAIQIAAQDTFIECGLPNTQATLQGYLDRQGGAQASDLCGSIAWTNDFPVVVDTCHGITSVTVNFTATDECGNTSITNAIVTLMGALGASVIAPGDLDFKVSPNPVHDQLKITVDNAESLLFSLYDVFGHQVLSLEEVGREINIDVSGIAPGMYLAHAKSSKGAYTLKVMIE